MKNDFKTMFLNLVLRHCVNITVFDKTEGTTAHENNGAGRPIVISAFVISIDDRWFLITAGHCLRDIEASRMAGQIYSDWQLDDGTRPDAKELPAIPFDYDSVPKLQIFDEESGTDYATFYLRPYYQKLLESNEILPFPNPWRKDIEDEFFAYKLIGVPSETVGARTVNGNMLQTYQPTVIGLTRIDQPTGVLTRGDWFYARLPDAEEEQSVKSIEGMSGGPIIGFGKGADNRVYYWLLALQSGWDRSKREIRACPIALFSKWMHHEIKSIE